MYKWLFFCGQVEEEVEEEPEEEQAEEEEGAEKDVEEIKDEEEEVDQVFIFSTWSNCTLLYLHNLHQWCDRFLWGYM